MPPVGRSQIEAHEIHRGNGLGVRLSLVLALSTIQPSGLESDDLSTRVPTATRELGTTALRSPSECSGCGKTAQIDQ
ncbi:hypothetical protein TNCV_2305091 [Trichonephila clavipes]|nr:hypothetical protein TNCV_2305091 [Trichonephila clavipes]